MGKTKFWKEISSDMFLEGCGMQHMQISTRYVRIFRQCFSKNARVKPHSHSNELEIVLGGPKRFSIYRPGVEHELSWPEKDGAWFIISIKIGKMP